ncbi:unnamed protein product [Adineta steineri]|uniref:Uncharacterized protein n=1 Tax=Adineta steineri TaxID=433720 RepID=A0A818RCN5_9BILA|nr:unnamed protein product [Adineta steineri]CAF3651678.1 unnamed protein product [Adineta steineri]
MCLYEAAKKNDDKSVEHDTSKITTTTDISYGKSEFDIIPSRNFQLDSTLTCNSEDKILYDGYITSINISLDTFFNKFGTTDNQLHFVTILDSKVLSTWKVTPQDNLLFHTFEISPWELVVKSGSFLCLATDNGDILLTGDSSVIDNKISATQSGKAVSFPNYFTPYDNIQSQGNEENLGIALSFIIAHNSMWNVTTPATPTTTIITLQPDTKLLEKDSLHIDFILNLDTTYGSFSDDVLNEGISLNSLFLYNRDDECREGGHIIHIKIQFCTPFLSENTLDGRLWFFTVSSNGYIVYRYPVGPLNTSLIQSFSFPQHTIFLQSGQYLSVGTISQNSDRNNKICLRKTGAAYSAKNIGNTTFNSNIHMNFESTESSMGIALSFVTLTNYETSLLDIGGPVIG